MPENPNMGEPTLPYQIEQLVIGEQYVTLVWADQDDINGGPGSLMSYHQQLIPAGLSEECDEILSDLFQRMCDLVDAVGDAKRGPAKIIQQRRP